jgi:hypothetical protein
METGKIRKDYIGMGQEIHQIGEKSLAIQDPPFQIVGQGRPIFPFKQGKKGAIVKVKTVEESQNNDKKEGEGPVRLPERKSKRRPQDKKGEGKYKEK